MCYGCEHGDRTDIGYMCQYRCLLLDNQISETVDTYFNTRTMAVLCPLDNQMEMINNG